MKIVKFFTILIAPLVVGVAFCIIILKVCNINFDSVTNLLLSKIPLVNQFVETTTNTGLYAISQLDKKELVTSSYNVDFLVSFYQSGKKTIILYPYEVEAGVNLEHVEQSKQDSLTIITLPNAEITKANIDDKKGSNVIRNQVDVDYNTHIIPLKTALERRAKDLAISAGILNEANENAEKYLSKLFPKQYFRFQKENIPYDTLKVLTSPHLPVTFTYQDKNLIDGKLIYQKDTIYSRDDLKFKDSKFGYWDKFSGTFQNLDDEILKSDILRLRIINPLNPKENRIYAKAYNLYRDIIICYPNGIYYMEGGSESAEEHLQKVAPDILYLAMSASDSGKGFDYRYMEWINEYETVLANMKNKRYKEASTHLFNMASIHSTMPASWEEILMNSYVKTKSDKVYHPTRGNDYVDLLLKAIYLFDNKKYNEMDDDFQTNLLALNDEEWPFIKENRNKLIQLFYSLESTSQSLKSSYKQRLIESAENYDHSVALTLKGQDYCDYMHRVLFHNDDEYNYYLTSGTHPNLRIIGHEENLKNDGFNGFDNICKLMREAKVLKEDEPQLVLAYVRKSGFFTKDHDLLIFEKNSCTICGNILGEKKYIYTTTYDNIDSNPINISFNIGSYMHKGKAISRIIQEIKDGINGYRKDDKTEDFSERLSEEMGSAIYQYCVRYEKLI